jgi:hypothetical protein
VRERCVCGVCMCARGVGRARIVINQGPKVTRLSRQCSGYRLDGGLVGAHAIGACPSPCLSSMQAPTALRNGAWMGRVGVISETVEIPRCQEEVAE